MLNALTGNLDREGGAMFPLAAAGQANAARERRAPGFATGRWRSRVRGLPESIGELPVATLADEIETPGEGQVRALITLGRQPVPVDAERRPPGDARSHGLDLMVSVDVYVNETTRHADVILPGPSPLERDHYDLALYQLAVRNVANWTPALVESDVPQEWETLLRLAAIAAGQGPGRGRRRAGRRSWPARSPGAAGPRPEPSPAIARARRGCSTCCCAAGPYDLTLADLEAAPHGIDLGPLQPRLPDVLRTPSGLVELAPERDRRRRPAPARAARRATG